MKMRMPEYLSKSKEFQDENCFIRTSMYDETLCEVIPKRDCSYCKPRPLGACVSDGIAIGEK